MEFIAPIAIGLITQFLNFIEIWLLVKKSRRKNPFEIILLSLAFADFFTGTAALLDGIEFLLYPHPSTAKNDLIRILLYTADAITALSIAASAIHIFLIAIERFTAVYFPIHQRVFISKRRNTRITLTVVWIVSAGWVFVCFFKFHIYLITSLVGVSLLMGMLVVIYGLIARKIILNNRVRQQICSGQSQVQGRREKIQHLVAINSGIIVACFIFCLSPWIIFAIRELLEGHTVERTHSPYAASQFSMFAVNSLLDPLIYFLVSYYRKSKGEGI